MITSTGGSNRNGTVKVGSDPIRSDLKGPGLPVVTVEHVYGTTSVFGCCEKYGTVAPRSVVGAKGYICSEDCASFPEEIFEILPPDTIRKLGVELSGEKDTEKGVRTLPTKSWVRVSFGAGERPFVAEVAIWMTASMSSLLGPEAECVGESLEFICADESCGWQRGGQVHRGEGGGLTYCS